MNDAFGKDTYVSSDYRKRPLPKLGSGGRFAHLKAQLARQGVRDPAALAAYIGRKKYGKARFQKLAAKGK